MNKLLKDLEEESKNILKKYANGKIAVLFSMGKDSTVMLQIIKKTYGKIPFDVVVLDNGLEFKEQYKFLHDKEKELGFKAIVKKTPPIENLVKGSGVSCCGINKANANKQLEKKYDKLIVAIRRDENPARANEKYVTEKRIHPILDWSELDIWNYIKENKIKVSPLYFAKNGERYRSLGCQNCSHPIKSNADTVDKIIKEIQESTETERSGRDKEKEQIMKKLRDLGYM